MKNWLIFFVIIFLKNNVFAQVNNKIELKGKVYSAQSRERLPGASISLYLSKDSLLVYRTFSDSSGLFKFDGIDNLNYYLLFSYVGFKSFIYPIRNKSFASSIDLGSIYMESSYLALSEVRIAASAPPIRLSRDTIEFNSDYYKVKKNAAVEELLRRLPGVEVGADGVIKVNGVVVKGILVDGHQLFSDDVALVAKNIQAELIDKVQLIDRRIKERDPLSLDDAQTEKFINITTRKDKRGLWFGSVMAGLGSNSRFATKLSLSRFNANEQIVFIGDGDNVNGFQSVASGGGVLKRWAPNFSYMREVNKKLSLNVNYIMDDSRRISEQSVIRQNNIESNYYYNQTSSGQTNNISHAITMRLNFMIDSMSSFASSSYLAYAGTENLLGSGHFIYGDQMQLLDSGTLTNRIKGNVLNVSNSLSFERRFKGNHRLNVELSYSDTRSDERGLNFSNTLYTQPGGERRWDTINQFNEEESKNGLLQFMTSYTLPVFQSGYIVASYGVLRYTNPLQRMSFDYNLLNHRYDILNDSLISSFSSKIVNQFGNVGFQFNKSRLDFNFSLMVMNPRLDVRDFYLGNDTHFRGAAILPRGYLNYSLSDKKRLKLFLTGNQILPTVDQLQLKIDNSNPLFIKKGNSNLKPARAHGILVSYNSIDPLTMKYFNLTLNGRVIYNQLVNAIWIDSTKKQINMPININGAYDIGINVSNSFPLKGMETAININSFLNFRRDVNMVNEVKVSSNVVSLGQSISFSYKIEDFFYFLASGSINYFKTSYPKQIQKTTSFLNCIFSLDGHVDLPLGFGIGSNFSYVMNAASTMGFNTHSVGFSAFLSKSLLNNKRGLIKVHGFDLLNQNLNVTRTIGSNYIEDTRINVLRRYFLVGFTYLIKQKN